MYTAGNPVMLVDPDGNTIVPTNEEANDILNGLLDSFGKELFNLSENPLKKNIYQIKGGYSVRQFKKQLIKNGYEKGSSKYKDAISLFKILRSKKRYYLTAISISSVTKKDDFFKLNTDICSNKDVDDFKRKYSVNDGKALRTPTDKEIDDFFDLGKSRGNRWALFDADANGAVGNERSEGRIFIHIHRDGVYSYNSEKNNINLLKTVVNEVSKEVKDVK
jgi:hypothetical protein